MLGVVICRVHRLVRALQWFVVTSYKCSVCPIINPNPMPSHWHMTVCLWKWIFCTLCTEIKLLQQAGCGTRFKVESFTAAVGHPVSETCRIAPSISLSGTVQIYKYTSCRQSKYCLHMYFYFSSVCICCCDEYNVSSFTTVIDFIGFFCHYVFSQLTELKTITISMQGSAKFFWI
jgi:hypothetical protein